MTEKIENVTLRPKKSSAFLLLAISLLFVISGILLGISGEWFGYLCAGFFGFGVPVAIVQLIPSSTYLEISSDGFTFCNLFRKTFTPWSVVDEFFVVHFRQTGVKVHEMVGFNYIPSYGKTKLGRKVAKIMSECEGALPDNYGKKAEELAEFMNHCLFKTTKVLYDEQTNEN